MIKNSKKDRSIFSISHIFQLIFLLFFIQVTTSGTVYALLKSKSTENELNTEKRKAIIKKVSEVLNKYYIFPKTAKNMEKSLNKKLNRGEYDKIGNLTDFTIQINKDLHSISKDLHIKVYPYRRNQNDESKTNPQVLRQQRIARFQKKNFGFRKVEILDGNIGYLDLQGFYDARYGGITAVAAMNFLSNCDALIIDLRKNTGGQPSMIQLICSYFFDESKHISSFYIREGEITNQFWTNAHVQGSRLNNTPIYIIVGKGTFSAAEGFAYALKHMNRATIIGEKTRGGAHPQRPYHFPKESISINVPYGKAINPITKTNWEGKGVIPNISAPTDEAFEVSYIEALKNLIEMEDDENVKHGLTMILEELKVKLNPVDLDKETLLQYTGNYSHGVKVKLENGSLKALGYYILIPMGNDKFMVKNGKEQVQFAKDSSGKISELVVIFRNGRKIPFKRLKD